MTRQPATGLYQTAVIGLFVLAVIAALYFARSIMVPIASALIVGLLFGPSQGRLVRYGVPGWLGSLCLVGLAVLTVIGLLRLIIIPFETWSNRLPEVWSELRYQLNGLKSMILSLQDVKESVEQSAGLDSDAAKVVVEQPGFLAEIAFTAPATIAQFIVFLGTLFFYLAGRQELHAQCLALCVTRHSRLQLARIFRDTEYAISNYLGTILLINIGLGAATSLALFLIGFPNPLLWGALAAVLNFAPYIGPLIVSVLLFGVGLLTYDTLWSAIFPTLIFFCINLVEANVVTPSIIGRTFTIQALAIFVSLAFWVWLWGFIGALLAVPMLLILQVIVLRLLGEHDRKRSRKGGAPAPVR